MPTYTITQFKAKAGQILDSLEDGDEVIITRRGKPYGKLTAVPNSEKDKPSLKRLKEHFSKLPDLDYEAFQDAKKIWEPRPLPLEENGSK